MKHLLFDLFLIVLLLFLLFFGNTYLKWVVYAFGLGGYYYFRGMVNLKEKFKDKTILILWIVFIITSVLSLSFSINLPLSLDKISMYLFSFISFYWASSLKNKRAFLKEYICISLCFHAIISLLYIIYISGIFIPNFFLESNLLYLGHGHSHFASWILLINPLLLWLSINKNKRIHIFSVANYLLLFLCFGRFGIFLGFIQLLLFYTVFKKELSKKEIIIFISLFSISIISFSTFLLSQRFPELSLFFERYFSFRNKISKDFYLLDRVSYWIQAWTVFIKNPYFGSGIGTYPLSIRESLVSPLTNTAHAHNSYLEFFAEIGFLGGISFLGLAVSLVISSIKNNINKHSISYALLISLISLSVNALFDYDWNYSLIFYVTILGFGLIYQNKSSTQKILSDLYLFIFQFFYKLCSALLILMACLYIILEVFILSGYPDKAFNLFPYILWHKYIYFEEVPSEKLFSIYQADSSFLLQATKKGSLNKDNQLLVLRLNSEPWLWMTTNMLGELIEDNKLELASTRAEQLMIDLLEKNWKGKENYHSLFDTQREVLANNYIQLADYYFNKHEYEKAGNFYFMASKLDDWAFSKLLPIFVSQKDYENFNNSIILKLIKIDKNQWGNNRMLWSEYLMKYLARDGVEQLSHEEAQLLIYVIKDVSGISSYELFNWFFSEINNNYEYFDNNRISSYQKTNELARLTILENSYYVWKTIKSFEEGLNKENEKKLAEALVIGGNDSYALASCKTSSLYQKALDIRPEIFNESSLWFEELSSDKYDSDQSLCYLYDYVKYLKEILNNRAIEHIKFCQREIELSLQRNENELAIKYAKIMMTLEPKEFNSQMQLGNVYYYLGNKKESLDAFNYCIQNYQNDNSHYGCEEAIELIEKNNYPKVAVIKIGEIIKEL